MRPPERLITHGFELLRAALEKLGELKIETAPLEGKGLVKREPNFEVSVDRVIHEMLEPLLLMTDHRFHHFCVDIKKDLKGIMKGLHTGADEKTIKHHLVNARKRTELCIRERDKEWPRGHEQTVKEREEEYKKAAQRFKSKLVYSKVGLWAAVTMVIVVILFLAKGSNMVYVIIGLCLLIGAVFTPVVDHYQRRPRMKMPK
ncbi:hypothetical protein ACFL0V_04645 [Nanoarchaeota archaeon]